MIPEGWTEEDWRECLESDVKMIDELLRAIGAKDGSCALEGLKRLAQAAGVQR